ncbi:TPA: hypothetical protein I7738_20035 [Vibrio vulnificus]|nr:hypothetical protein [Vibrio vulnificus]
MKELAPVIVFVYSRVDHAKATLEALNKNIGAQKTNVYVFSDSPKSEKDISDVKEVRKYLNETKFCFAKFDIIQREENFGLARNIIFGVTEIVKKYGKVIVLEDDIVTSEFFLNYMNDALLKYENVDEVISISACTYPVGDLIEEQDTYLLRIPLCWGWATWSTSWSYFKKDLDEVALIDKNMINYINFDGANDYFKQAVLNVKGKLNTWFIFWYIASVKNKKLTLFPRYSLVKNIGHDGSGENCGKTDSYQTEIVNNPVRIEDIPLVESKYAVDAHKKYFRSINPPIFIKFKNRIIRGIGRIL